MKNAIRSLGLTLPVLAVTLAATVMRSVACLRDMDYSTGFFGGSLTATVANWAMLLVVAVLLSALIIKVEKPSLRPSFSGPLTYLPSGVLAIALLFLSIEILQYVHEPLYLLFEYGFKAIKLSAVALAVSLLAALLALVAVAYCAASVLISEPRNILRANLGMFAALFFAIYAAFLFFRGGASINQPQRVLTEITVLAAAIFFLEETRVSLGRERWRAYFVFGGITALLSFYNCVPALILYAFKGELLTSGIAELMLAPALLLFSVCRLISNSIRADEKPSPYAVAISASAPEEKDAPEEELSQISIEEVVENDERQTADEEDPGN